jgi:hypothetical protein
MTCRRSRCETENAKPAPCHHVLEYEATPRSQIPKAAGAHRNTRHFISAPCRGRSKVSCRLTCTAIQPSRVQHSPASKKLFRAVSAAFAKSAWKIPHRFQGQTDRPHFFCSFLPTSPLPRTSAQSSIKTWPLPPSKTPILSPPSATQSDNLRSSSTQTNTCLSTSLSLTQPTTCNFHPSSCLPSLPLISMPGKAPSER